MNTPEGWPGEVTEAVMARIISTLRGRALAQFDTRTYNAVFECVFEVIFREYSRPDIRTAIDAARKGGA